MKHITYFFLVALICALSSCIPQQRHYVLFSIKNNSNKSIYFEFSRSYPDTSLDNTPYVTPGSTRTPSEIVSPGQKLDALISPTNLDNYFTTVPSGKLEVFIYDVNTVKTEPWDTVVAKYLILKRYDLTIDDLKKMNGVITYP